MISEWLSDQGFLVGPALALGVFLAVFAGVLLWIYRPGSTRAYEHEAQLPFDEGVRPPRLTGSPARED
jgi:cbb3-type cytochrome oxidase subunit 3